MVHFFRVGVSMRLESRQYASGLEWRDALSHDWGEYLAGQGIAFQPIPNIGAQATQYLQQIDALILTGGGDPIEKIEHDWKRHPESRRDITERALLEFAVAQNIPVFGVCRGMQMIHHFFGGSLKQVAPEGSHAGLEHSVTISESSRLLPLSPASLKVNSFHQFAVDRLPNSLRVVATSEEGLIEAFEHEDGRIAGVMWHPERPFSDSTSKEINKTLVRRFLEQI